MSSTSTSLSPCASPLEAQRWPSNGMLGSDKSCSIGSWSYVNYDRSTTPTKSTRVDWPRKQQQRLFPAASKYRVPHLLDLVHADLCGPITPMTPRRKLFLLVDDESFHVAHVAGVKELGCSGHHPTLGTLRTDHSGESTTHTFNNYNTKHDIQHHLTMSYTPQQNDIERHNQTMFGKTRTC
jgi:hypothetical protein